jgi:hypothetical protein
MTRSWSFDESKKARFLLGKRSSYDLPDTRKFMTRVHIPEHGVSNDPETFSYVIQTYERACTHTKASQIV